MKEHLRREIMNTEKQKTPGIRRKAGYLLTMAGMAFALLMTMAQQALALNVAIMPSNSQNPAWGLAQQNASIQLWGRAWNISGSIDSATIDPGDGTGPLSVGTNGDFLALTHTYASFGVKTVTITVSDTSGASESQTAKIKVLATPTAEERVNMAIEKGLLYLYKTAFKWDDNHVFWYSADSASTIQNINNATAVNNATYISNYVGQGVTGSCLLAFEENGHLPGLDPEQYIYADLVRKGLSALLDFGAGEVAIGGAADSGINGPDGKAVFLYNDNNHGTYANSFAAMAFFLSQVNETAAKDNTVVSSNPVLNGRSYYDIGINLVDGIEYFQGSSGNWEYKVNSFPTRHDGSTQQWPVLLMITAKERWGIQPLQQTVDKAFQNFQYLQSPGNGGIGYASNTHWLNTSKTGGILVAGALKGISPGLGDDAFNNSLDRAISFLGSEWDRNAVSAPTNIGPVGQSYGMYGVKKGFALLGIETFSTDLGVRDWYKDFSSWLLADPGLWSQDGYTLHGSVTPSYRNYNYLWGQAADGSWESVVWIGQSRQFDTSHAILVLTQAVTVPLPVAQIAPIGDALGEVAAGDPVDVDGLGSFHQDSNLTIDQYLWIVRPVDGNGDPVGALDWTNPDATGALASLPAPNVGEYEVTLRVRDNNPDETQFDTDSARFTATNKNFGPTANPGPNEGTVYTAKFTENGPDAVVTLQGSGTDPEDDDIVSYSWDLNGDGIYGDDADDLIAGGDSNVASPTLYFDAAQTITVALKVCSENTYLDQFDVEQTETQCSSNSAQVQIFISESDLGVTSIEASNVVSGVSADISAIVYNDALSGSSFNPVLVRFFDGDPDLGAPALGPAQSISLPQGGSVEVSASVALTPASTFVFVKVDSNDNVDEWNEQNNAASVNVSNKPPVLLLPPNGVVANVDAGSCGAVVSELTIIGNSYDPDPEDVLEVTLDPEGPYGVGTTSVTVTISDGEETKTGTVSVTVVDNISPTALAKDITVQLDANGNASITTSDVDNGSSDNCGFTLSVSPNIFDCANVGVENVVTLTITDASGLSDSATAIVTVEDNIAPIALTKDITIELDETGNASIVAADVDNGSSDNCAFTLSVSPSTFDCANVGVPNEVTLTITDASGHSDSATASVTVLDNIAPIALAKNITIELDETGNASIVAADVDNGSSDNCGFTLSVSPSSFDCSNVGVNDVILTITDASGNSDSAPAIVTVVDNTVPTLSISGVDRDGNPVELVEDTDGTEGHDWYGIIQPNSVSVTFTVIASDNCLVSQALIFDCWAVNGAGKEIDKTESCVVTTSQDGTVLTIVDSGGVNDNITFTATAIDAGGNQEVQTVHLLVVNPGNGGGSGGGSKGNNGVGNGEDPQPAGNPPVNDGEGTSKGNPGNKGGKK